MQERTLIIIKPDGMPYKDEVMKRIEAAGFKISAHQEPFVATRAQLDAHYEGIGKLQTRFTEKGIPEIYEQVLAHMMSGVLQPMIVEGENAVQGIRDLAGATRPSQAAPGTIRGDLGKELENGDIHNVIHASADADEAAAEIALWFPEAQ